MLEAIVPRGEYEGFCNVDGEDQSDIVVALPVLEDADEEPVPFELTERIATVVHPIRVRRVYRGMTASSLATLIDLMCRGLLFSRGLSPVAIFEG